MRRGAFVSRDWLGPVLAALVSSSALEGAAGATASPVVLAVVTCFGWGALARTLLAARRLQEARRTVLLRAVCVAQCLSVAAIWAVSMAPGQFLPALAVLVAGVTLSALVWPWPWRLAQAAEDRVRSHDPALCRQHLTAAGILLVLAAGCAIALSGLLGVLLLALATSSVVDAWDEWRRPRSDVRAAGAARRRGRRPQQRYSGRRVATRRS